MSAPVVLLALSISLTLLLEVAPASASVPLQPKVGDVKGYVKLNSWGNSSLYQLLTDSDYATEPLLVHLVGSRYNMGYAYGFMLSEEISNAYHSLLDALIGRSTLDQALIDVLGIALDWQWKDYMSKELPSEYVSELQGLDAGGKAAGCEECGKYSTRAIVLANFPSDLKDLIYIFLREVKGAAAAKELFGQKEVVKMAKEGDHCSMFAVWGSRTVQSKLFSGRNLDWYYDTGVNKNKVIMVTVPDDGGFPSVTLGFVGLYGTLAGMSAKGLTVHEANLEENVESFVGFPWTLRLRYVMEKASNIMEAKQLWESTNNTVGFNHMVASGPDAIQYASGMSKGPVALAMETMYLYTAYFADDDPREANATYQPQQGPPVHIGFPMQEAVWRTNHGYDPTIRAHFMWSQAPSSWSMQRYMFLHNALLSYELSGVKIDYMQAINITAIAGDTGKDPYSCPTSRLSGGSHNVLSVTFQPQDSIVYVAWERNSGANWRPAACSTYIKLDLTPWFSTIPPGL